VPASFHVHDFDIGEKNKEQIASSGMIFIASLRKIGQFL
jgi:hypothetical protein